MVQKEKEHPKVIEIGYNPSSEPEFDYDAETLSKLS